MLAFVNGVSLCMGLIVSIGPQNAELIRAGLFREQAFLLATVYVVCDMLFIMLGVLGVAHFISLNIWIEKVVSWAAVSILFYMAWHAFERMKACEALAVDNKNIDLSAISVSRRATIKKGLVLSIFNPLVILETVIIIGSAASQYQASEKIYFAAGAMISSITWFYTVSFSAQRFSHLLNQPRGRQVLEGVIGVLLCCVACLLAYKAW